jgi:hypothetical protein
MLWVVRRATLSLLVGLALAACGRGEDRPGIVTADDPPTTTTTAPAAEADYVPSSDVAADIGVVGAVARLRTLLAGAGAVDWEAAAGIWRGGPDRIADLPEVTQVVDDAIAGRGVASPDGVRAARARAGLEVILAVRVREELAEADARLSDTDAASHDIDQAWAYFQGGHRLAAVGPAVVSLLATARDAAAGGNHGQFAAAVAEVEAVLDAFFHGEAVAALRDEKVAVAQAFYTAIGPRLAAAAPHTAREVDAAWAAGDAARALAALESAPARQLFAV